MLTLLNRRRSSGAWGFCHFDLALRFDGTKRLMPEGKLLTGLRGCLLGVAAWAACCRMPMNLVVAISISSHVLSFIAEFTLSRTSVLYFPKFVCEVCSRGAICRATIVVLMVTIMRV
jgi:hypothetical protein